MDESVIINVENISKTIKGNTVLKDISLKIETGKIYGFIGHNGSGKTMLFRAIIGLIPINIGKINKKEQLKIGAIIESPGFLLTYTGFQNLKLLASINGTISDEIINETMLRVGLDPTNKKKVKSYSLGMKQKLAIAQAIMESPDVLVLDEPTNGLDYESVLNVYSLLKEERKRGKTILIASHNKDDIKALSDEIYKLDNGKLYSYEECVKKSL